MNETYRWIIGLTFSLFFGWLGTWIFITAVRKCCGLKPKEYTIPPWLTGLVERSFFTLLIGLNFNAVAPAMATWIVIKMATNWNDYKKSKSQKREYAFSALLASLVSMIFAIIGGAIIIEKINLF